MKYRRSERMAVCTFNTCYLWLVNSPVPINDGEIMAYSDRAFLVPSPPSPPELWPRDPAPTLKIPRAVEARAWAWLSTILVQLLWEVGTLSVWDYYTTAALHFHRDVVVLSLFNGSVVSVAIKRHSCDTILFFRTTLTEIDKKITLA